MPISRCEKTGATDAATKWTMLSEMIFGELRDRRSFHGYEILLQDRRYFNVQWAGNWLLLASQLSGLHIMIQELTDVILKYQLFWKIKSLGFPLNGPLDACPGYTVQIRAYWPEGSFLAAPPVDVSDVQLVPNSLGVLSGNFIIPRRRKIVAPRH
eukprot:466916-Pyramimonas_sp.AAC.1